MNKSDLRGRYIAKRSGLSDHNCRTLSEKIAARFFEKVFTRGIRWLHHFIPVMEKKEVDCLFIVKQIQEIITNLRIAVPRINSATGELESIQIDDKTRFETSKWGIKEPLGQNCVDEIEFDLVLVPLLVFDTNGHRVGYGKGYYDRFLSKCRPNCIKVGLSYFDPVDKIDGIHQADVRLDYCVTPKKVYELND